MAPFKWLLTIGFLLAASAADTADAQPADALRAWCYTMGSMHSNDGSDPALIGIPVGPCRDSYDAGRAYSQQEEKRSAASLNQMNELLKDSCRDAKSLIAMAERKGDFEHAADLRALASACYR